MRQDDHDETMSMWHDDLLPELEARGRRGLDGSPGDLFAAWAAFEISRLRTKCGEERA